MLIVFIPSVAPALMFNSSRKLKHHLNNFLQPYIVVENVPLWIKNFILFMKHKAKRREFFSLEIEQLFHEKSFEQDLILMEHATSLQLYKAMNFPTLQAVVEAFTCNCCMTI